MKIKGRKAGKRPGRFSMVAAVKENARRQVGQPPPARSLPVKTPERANSKHKPTLASVLASADREIDPDHD